MAIDFDSQILPLYATCVDTDPNYESLDAPHEQRLLTTLEVVRSYIAMIYSAQEAKVFHSSMSKIISSIPTGIGTGAEFPASQVAASAIQKGLSMFGRAARPLPAPQPKPLFEPMERMKEAGIEIIELFQEPIAVVESPKIVAEPPEIVAAPDAPDETIAAPDTPDEIVPEPKKPATKRRKKTEALA